MNDAKDENGSVCCREPSSFSQIWECLGGEIRKSEIRKDHVQDLGKIDSPLRKPWTAPLL